MLSKLGLMGVTVLYSSGDTGVAGRGNLCLTPDGQQTTSGKIFNPKFPSAYLFRVCVDLLSQGIIRHMSIHHQRWCDAG